MVLDVGRELFVTFSKILLYSVNDSLVCLVDHVEVNFLFLHSDGGEERFHVTGRSVYGEFEYLSSPHLHRGAVLFLGDVRCGFKGAGLPNLVGVWLGVQFDAFDVVPFSENK